MVFVISGDSGLLRGIVEALYVGKAIPTLNTTTTSMCDVSGYEVALSEYPLTELLNCKDYPEFAPLVSWLLYFVLLFAVVKLQEVRTEENGKFSAFYIDSAANLFFFFNCGSGTSS